MRPPSCVSSGSGITIIFVHLFLTHVVSSNATYLTLELQLFFFMS